MDHWIAVRFWTGLAVGGAATLASPAIVRASDGIVWKMPMSWPKQLPGVGVNGVRFAERVGKMSGGRLTIRVFGAGVNWCLLWKYLMPFPAVLLKSVMQPPTIGRGKDPSFHFYTGVPFGLTQIEHTAWLRFGGGQELWERAYEPFNVIPFYAGASGTQAGGWFAKELKTLDDLKGLKMRIAGLGGEVAPPSWRFGHHVAGNGYFPGPAERNDRCRRMGRPMERPGLWSVQGCAELLHASFP